MNKLWEFWIRVYQRTLGGQEKPSLREVAPLPLSPFFLCRGEGAVHVGQEKPNKKPAKARGKKYRKPGSEPSSKLHDPFYDVMKGYNNYNIKLSF